VDKTAKPVEAKYMRGEGESVVDPKLRTPGNPGPTRDLRGVEANTNVDKGKPYTTSDITEIQYGGVKFGMPFRTRSEGEE
jgi:hypothetical protein